MLTKAMDFIRAFAAHQLPEGGSSCSEPVVQCETSLQALKLLVKTNKWLRDRPLVEHVVSRLEAMETHNQQELAKIATVYMKIIGPGGAHPSVKMSTTLLKISEHTIVDLPTRLLKSESSVFEERLSAHADQPLDLSGQASEKTLTVFIDHLRTGNVNIVTSQNAVELLLLAKQYKLNKLATKCLQYILLPQSGWLNKAAKGRPLSSDEMNLHGLLIKARLCSISVSQPAAVMPHIIIGDGPKDDQLECLKRLHDFMPITHLELREGKNRDVLIEFLAYNPDLTSLNLGESPEVDDSYLVSLSKYLSKLEAFSIHSSTIRAIPATISDRVTALNVSRCHSLTSISTGASTLICNHCSSLDHIEAPKAQLLNCTNCHNLVSAVTDAIKVDFSCCSKLKKIVAPLAATLKFHYCPALESVETLAAGTVDGYHCASLMRIDAPNTRTIDCARSLVLARIDAPSATVINCLECNTLTTIVAPEAREINCSGCPALIRLDAEKVETLNCASCTSLASLNIPNVKTLGCSSCAALGNIIAPQALSINCPGCKSLKRVEAPKATKLSCPACSALSAIVAPLASRINCYGCDCLTDDVLSKLFNTVRKNIVKSNNTSPDALLQRLSGHFRDAAYMFGLKNVKNLPINRWLIDAMQLPIPADFDSEADRLKCADDINGLLTRLMLLAASDETLKDYDFSWFMQLKRRNSLQHQMSRLIWLWCVMACIDSPQNPLADPEADAILKVVGSQADPFLMHGATRSLLSIYDIDEANQKEDWKALRQNSPEHMLLQCLFLARTNIGTEKALELLKGLEVRYYRDSKLLSPIQEMTYMLSQEVALSAPEKEKILSLALKAPEKGERENAKAFNRRVEAFRSAQTHYVTACRDLLLFGQGHELADVHTTEDLIEKHKGTCRTTFGVDEDLLPSFTNIFKSKRYPNGLYTYAARLQILPDDQKTALTKLLAKFVNGHLKGEFPANRYDLNDNPHLNTIFQENERLFDRWKEPFEIDLTQENHMMPEEERDPSFDAVTSMMRQAIDDQHLGAEQQALYPTLVRALTLAGPEEQRSAVVNLQNKLLQGVASGDPDAAKQKLRHMEIEVYCLQALDRDAHPASRIMHLRAVLERLPESAEFRNDVQGMINALDPAKSSSAEWIKLQTSDAWEDCLLMGTEVNNSCQRIDGDPNYNKCLLAYILDGKNQLMIVRDAEGRIAARSVLRILWDSEASLPVLFMERIYIRTADPALAGLITKGCVEKAKKMGLPLVASKTTIPTGHAYSGMLHALGGPAPFEYVDALSGIQKDGVFTIPVSNILFMPTVAHALSKKRIEIASHEGHAVRLG